MSQQQQEEEQPRVSLPSDAELEAASMVTTAAEEGEEADSLTSRPIQSLAPDYEWSAVRDQDIMNQHYAIQQVEALKIPLVGDKEPLSTLAVEYKSGSPILQEKIKILDEQFSALRRTCGDGNCFFRSFMFAYLEHIFKTKDEAEVNRVTESIEKCKRTLLGLGYTEFTFEDFFSTFLDQLESVLQDSFSHEVLLERSRDQSISNYVVMFFRFITSSEIRKRSDFFEPFIFGLSNTTVDQFCKSSVEPMGEESDHVHITALSDALGVPIRVMYLDRSSCDTGPQSVNHHDFFPSMDPPPQSDGSAATTSTSASASGPSMNNPPNPLFTLLYRPGHYDILYPK